MDHPAFQSHLPTSSAPDTVAAPEQPVKPSSSNWKKWIIIGGAVSVIMLTGTAYVLSQQKSQEPDVANTAKQVVTQPSPAPDPTADWKMYKDELGGFEYNYPSNWDTLFPCSRLPSPTYCDGPQNISIVRNYIDSAERSPQVTDQLFQIEYFSPAECSYQESQLRSWGWKNLQETRENIDGLDMKVFTGEIILYEKSNIYHKRKVLQGIRNKYCYQIDIRYGNPPQDKTLDQILSTFKFTKQSFSKMNRTPCASTCDIKEWGIRLSFADADKLDYEIESFSDTTTQRANFYLNSKVSKDACSTIIASRYPTKPSQDILDRQNGRVVQLENYFYTVWGQRQAVCTVATSDGLNTKEVELQEQLIQKIVDEIRQGQYTLTLIP